MPRPAQPPRLWKRPERRDKKTGKITHAATWVILDGGRQFSTGVHADDPGGAGDALKDYLTERHTKAAAQSGPRPENRIPVADVLNLYARDVVPGHSNPVQTAKSIARLGRFFRGLMLADINGAVCREYAAEQSSQNTALFDLRYLRAAVNHHLKEGHHRSIIKIWTPADPVARERWGTRSEVARLLLAAWRKKNSYGKPSMRAVARFIIVAAYTGTRSATVTHTALQREPGLPWIDTENGIYHRRPEGAQETKKRRPAIPLPPRVLAHVRRWKRLGLRFVTERNGHPVYQMSAPFRVLTADTGIDDFVPHTLRHTAATWLMQRGCDPWMASGYLGMSLKTLMKVYGHHHPDHLKGVHEAFYSDKPANGLPTNDANQTETFVGGRKLNSL